MLESLEGGRRWPVVERLKVVEVDRCLAVHLAVRLVLLRQDAVTGESARMLPSHMPLTHTVDIGINLL